LPRFTGELLQQLRLGLGVRVGVAVDIFGKEVHECEDSGLTTDYG
jgi:hypothetical protein